jgi:hypothetical protein
MIKGTTKTESEYRAVDMNSSSSLKDFSLDRKKYHRKYVKNEKVEEKDSGAATMGRLVETLLMEPELFDERFYMSSLVSAPTGLMLEFVEALYRITMEATDEEGNVKMNFEYISRAAYAASGFKIKYDAVIGKFVGSDAELYYNELRQVRAKGLSVVTTEDVTNAERIVEELKTNSFTADIVNKVTSARWEVFNQFQIEGYEIDGMKLKSMIDKLIIDHETKQVHIYDLKCVWAVENFYTEYYLYRRAYIQAFLYHRAIMSMEEFEGYEVLPPKFIVCDSSNYYSPLIYKLTVKDLDEAYEGFEYKGREYPGVKAIIEELKWALENDIWNVSMTNFLNRGVVFLKDHFKY